MYLHCNMQPSTDAADYLYSTILIFKLNFKYLGLQDLRCWFETAFTFILCFTLLGAVCFGAVPSKELYDPSPGHHFNRRCIYHLSSNSCAMLGHVQPFQGFLPPLWADSIKKYYSGLKNYIFFLNNLWNSVKCKGRPTTSMIANGHGN